MNKNEQSYSSTIESHRKKRDIRDYYKFRKAELIHALEAARLVEQTSNKFDESFPNDTTPVSQPTPWRPSNIATKNKQNIKKIHY